MFCSLEEFYFPNFSMLLTFFLCGFPLEFGILEKDRGIILLVHSFLTMLSVLNADIDGWEWS